MRHCFAVLFLFLSIALYAQKKPLDHSVYDGWQSITERMISGDGRWVVYTVSPQEGDASLFIRSSSDTAQRVVVPRGYNAVITDDSRFVVFRIKPTYKETRDARIKKRKPEDMPKDSFGIVQLGKESVLKFPKVKSYKVPEKAAGWVAFHKEREPLTARQAAAPTQRTIDSLRKTIDSLTLLVSEIKNVKAGNRDGVDADEDGSPAAAVQLGSDLVLRNLATGKDRVFRNVADYFFNAYGQKLLMKVTRSQRDSSGANAVVLFDLKKGSLDTLLKGGNDFRSLVISEDGRKVAFVAERDTATKVLQRFYGLYVYRAGDDSAQLLVDKHTPGMQLGLTVSENATINFSKSGRRLLFGTALLPQPKDTSLVDIDLVKVDVWHYKDDYLQTTQLFQLNNELKRSFLAVYDFSDNNLSQLGSPGLPTVIPMNEGDGEFFIAFSDTGRRVATQWAGQALRDVYAVDVKTGKATLVKKNHRGSTYASPGGKYIAFYDPATKHYSAWDGKTIRNITNGIKVPLEDEENDVPGDPDPHGIMAWHQGDSSIYIYDRYDVWKVDPRGATSPVKLTNGRKDKIAHRYVKVDNEERFIRGQQKLYFRLQNQVNRNWGMAEAQFGKNAMLEVKPITGMQPKAFQYFAKAKGGNHLLVSAESYTAPADLYSYAPGGDGYTNYRLSNLNPQQQQYNWGTAELYKWKTFDGKPGEGILYRPENFDSTKKYPVLIYFYERVTDGLFNYTAPAPTPSRLNIPFFVSRGYIVLAPDIRYTKGHPGKDAYNYIVSGAQALAKKKWIDAKNMGIQGQSWGGYQVAYLITATDMFKAAWAGAPVVNMFSAYGGIRWESGNNRQFQYEKGQSRIGATPWERPDLYIENSPFFHLHKVKTPLVIMANDADGAVPWYQGIEFFTAMRRLGKPVWMLNYNGEAHNLVERKNRKDIQVREQQYFDWLLKGEKPARWITDGVPAVKKGRDWGLATVDEEEK